ncbi:g3659 [Coccomyxa elongata]
MVPVLRMFEVVVATAFYSGLCYMVFEGTARQLGKFGLGSSMFSTQKAPEMLIITAIHSKSCVYKQGDHLNFMSVVNKQDYARLHNYKVIAATNVADPTLDNMWNKVGWLLKVYHEHPETEWFMWIDSDTMIINPTFQLPLNKFAGKDLVIWGNETALLSGDGRSGMNSGVMLFRRTPWMEEFLEQVATLGRIPEPELGEVLKKELTAPGYIYDSGLRDQNAIVYVMKTGWKEHKSHVLLINKQYCLNCYWKDLLQSGDLSSDDKKVNFINHFSGCQLCTRQNKEGNYGQCEAEFVKSFEYANGIFTKLLKRMPPRDIAHQMQLAETPYCKDNERHKECRVAVTAVAAYKERKAEELRARLDADDDMPVARRQLKA